MVLIWTLIELAEFLCSVLVLEIYPEINVYIQSISWHSVWWWISK